MMTSLALTAMEAQSTEQGLDLRARGGLNNRLMNTGSPRTVCFLPTEVWLVLTITAETQMGRGCRGITLVLFIAGHSTRDGSSTTKLFVTFRLQCVYVHR